VQNSEKNAEFYVGYLPMPPTLKRVVRNVILTAAALLLLVSALIAAAMRDAGVGSWDTEHVTTVEGTMLTEPYAMLVKPGEAEALVLVEEGKFGVRAGVASMAHKKVRASGHLLARGSRRVLELLPTRDAIEVVGDAQAGAIPSQESSPVTLVGEIVDPKCFAGAMKPGDQKTHKGCAVLCLRGGIPPAFAVWDEAGRVSTLMLVSREGLPLSGDRLEVIVPFVGDRVEARGTLIETNGGAAFRMDLDSLHRR
jgi:hypothetical protein